MPSDLPKVSVIMNCFNGEKYLREAIDSVYAQTYKDWEIILWDDASTDKTPEIAESYDERLRYFRGEKAVSLGEARNRALEKARGDYIAFLDQDDIWLPNKLEKQMPLFEDPEVGLVFSDAIIFNERGQSRRLYSYTKYYTGYCFPKLLSEYFLGIETVVIRRSALEKEKMQFDPNFSIIEETDLFSRIGYKWKLAMVNEPLAKWRVHPASSTWLKAHLVADETSLMLKKYHENIPDFARRFSHEIKTLENQTSIKRAKTLWKSGKSQEARKCLAALVFRNKKAFILSLMTFFPENLIFPFVSKFRRTILPN